MNEFLRKELEPMSADYLALLDKLGIKIIGIDAGARPIEQELSDTSWARGEI